MKNDVNIETLPEKIFLVSAHFVHVLRPTHTTDTLWVGILKTGGEIYLISHIITMRLDKTKSGKSANTLIDYS